VSEPITYRRYRDGDEAAINEGFERVFHTHRPIADWYWKFAADAEARAVLVATDAGGRVLAHFGGIRECLLVEGREYRVAQTVDVFAVPEVRRSLSGAAVYLETARAFFREFLGAHDLAAVYGFPGPRHEPLLVRHLRCRVVQPVTVWERPLPGRFPWWTAHDVQAGWDAAAVDTLWRRAAPRYPVALRRDAARLARRFTGRPGVAYELLVAWRRRAPRALAVLRVGAPETVLADVLWDGGDPRAVVALLRAACRRAAATGAATVSAWMDGDAACQRVLADHGWVGRPHPAPVNLLMRLEHPDLDRDALAGRVYVTAADADLV
jgi:hypothetical protein